MHSKMTYKIYENACETQNEPWDMVMRLEHDEVNVVFPGQFVRYSSFDNECEFIVVQKD